MKFNVNDIFNKTEKNGIIMNTLVRYLNDKIRRLIINYQKFKNTKSSIP